MALIDSQHAAGFPDWFQSALAVPSERQQTTVDGCSINYVVWGSPGRPGLVLIHGSNAHLEWWRPIAPLLAGHFHIVALDSSGSGESGWRDAYSGEQFAREVMGVAAAAGLADNFYVAGHSFGGIVALEAGHLFGAQLGGIVMLDFTLPSPDQVDEYAEMRKQRRNEPTRPTRVYEDKATALARFRLVPEQPCKNPFLIGYLAEHALREVPGGWTWKFDPGMFRNLTFDETGPDRTRRLLDLLCPAAFVMAEQSLDYSPESRAYTARVSDGILPVITIPGTFHHLMFDEPLAVAMALQSLLLGWHHGSHNGRGERDPGLLAQD